MNAIELALTIVKYSAFLIVASIASSIVLGLIDDALTKGIDE